MTGFPRNGARQPWVEVALRLLHWSAGDRSSPLQEADRVWSNAQSCLELLRKRRIDSLLYFGCALDAAPQRVYDKVWRLQFQSYLDFIQLLEQEGITPPLLLKGAELCSGIYGGRSLGFLADVDALLPRLRMGAAKRALYALGFRQAMFDPALRTLVDFDVSEIAATEGSHYELASFRKIEFLDLEADEMEFVQAWSRPPIWSQDGRGLVVLKMDIHHGVTIDIDSQPLFERAVPSSSGHGLTLSLADHLWFMTSKYYTEVAIHGKRYLRDFAYIAALLRQPGLNWDVVLQIAQDFDLRPALYYYLAFTDRLAGGVIPDSVLEALLPTKGSRLRDWGWQLASLFEEIDPFPFSLVASPLDGC